jgi:diaminobutyrate-2-oxoglutarate transaminase
VTSPLQPFARLESEVRSYIRSFPVVFETARGAIMTDESGDDYIDFFAGAGALNYGHNNPDLQRPLLEYLTGDGITHSLDMATVAKRTFMEAFDEVILQPRGLSYRMLFPGPTGTNAVEAALKIARKATGRSRVISFTNGFHGMTLGSLALTGNQGKRDGAGVSLDNVSVMPFDGYYDGIDSLSLIEQMLEDNSSGVPIPAAFVLETVQAEGGVHVASPEWLAGLAAIAKRHGILLIADDIQVGCGRTGPFFSFERAGITPDIVCLSKSLSGYGLPMAMVLLRPDLDVFTPGEHNGTFRGHMPAFVTATAALEHWRDDALTQKVERDAALVEERLQAMAKGIDAEVRGLGLIQGLAFEDPDVADHITRTAFENGLVIETAGPQGEVVKLLPALVIEREQLVKGLDILEDAVNTVCRGDDTVPVPLPRPTTDAAAAEVSA